MTSMIALDAAAGKRRLRGLVVRFPKFAMTRGTFVANFGIQDH